MKNLLFLHTLSIGLILFGCTSQNEIRLDTTPENEKIAEIEKLIASFEADPEKAIPVMTGGRKMPSFSSTQEYEYLDIYQVMYGSGKTNDWKKVVKQANEIIDLSDVSLAKSNKGQLVAANTLAMLFNFQDKGFEISQVRKKLLLNLIEAETREPSLLWKTFQQLNQNLTTEENEVLRNGIRKICMTTLSLEKTFNMILAKRKEDIASKRVIQVRPEIKKSQELEQLYAQYTQLMTDRLAKAGLMRVEQARKVLAEMGG